MYPTENTEWAVRMFAHSLAVMIVERWQYNQQLKLEHALATGVFYEI